MAFMSCTASRFVRGVHQSVTNVPMCPNSPVILFKAALIPFVFCYMHVVILQKIALLAASNFQVRHRQSTL